MNMRRLVFALLTILLVLLVMAPAQAATSFGGTQLLPSPGPSPIIIRPELVVKPPALIAFSAVPNRYTDVDPATTFDLNGDLVGDLKVSATTVTGQNGALVQLVDPAALSLDQVQSVPQAGYSASAAVLLSRVYVAQLPGGWYAKFMLIQVSPKVTIWFHAGQPTTSELKADGTGGKATLSWTALPDAALGYNVYRYEFLDNNAYTVTLLNDFAVQETTFTDNTAKNHYYLYVVIAMKAGGAFGAQTTVAAVQVQSLQRSIVISLSTGTAKLDGSPVTLASPPVIRNGRLMVPAKLFENAGVKVTYEAASGHVTLARRLDNVTYTVVMTIDRPEYTWNGSAYQADVPPYLAGSVVMIPLRVAAPALGFGLTFDSATRNATLQWFE
jgi:hypothetical protein